MQDISGQKNEQLIFHFKIVSFLLLANMWLWASGSLVWGISDGQSAAQQLPMQQQQQLTMGSQGKFCLWYLPKL